jgi:hypothetical protein
MENAFVIYQLSRTKIQRIERQWFPSNGLDRGHIPYVSKVSELEIKDMDEGPPIFPDDLDMSHDSLTHHHNLMEKQPFPGMRHTWRYPEDYERKGNKPC